MDRGTGDLEALLRGGLADRAEDVPAAPGDLYERVLAGHRSRRRRSAALAGVVAAVVAAAVVVPFVLDGRAPDRTAAPAPAACIDTADATRDSIEGTPVWVRFCPGDEGYTAPAEAPSDALTTHLDLLAGLDELDEVYAGGPPPGYPCGELSGGRTYEVQIGFADGGVATLVGDTDPGCTGRLGDGRLVRGPDTVGVYGLVMTAFGRQYADGFASSPSTEPLVCPADPRDPDSVDVDGASASLDTGYLLGERSPMVMPLTAVRGIVCTWPFGAEDGEPAVRELTPEEAERVRIGLHAVPGGTADCGRFASPEPTRAAVVEDRTGTRRAVTILGSECSAVIRSDAGPYGLGNGVGFAWLDR